MPRYYNFSPVNSLMFVPLERGQSEQYHYIHLGQDLHKYRGRTYEENPDFLQPVQFSDRIVIQFEENYNGTPTLEVFKDSGTAIASLVFTVVEVSGNADPEGNQLYTYQWEFRPIDIYALTEEGIYTFKITSGYPTAAATFISEPIELKEDHPDTLLIQYTHSVNEYDTIFTEDLEPRFSLRVPSSISRPIPDGEDEIFDDQVKSPTLLSGQPFRTYRFFIGTTDGVPDWLLDKLNYIIHCDTIKLDGFLFVKEDDSKWELKEAQSYSLRGAEIVIRDQDPSIPYSFRDDVVKLRSLPNQYPYFISQLRISQGLGILNVITDKAIYNATDLALLIANLNTSVSTLGLGGYFSVSDNTIYYHNTEDENYTPYSFRIFEKHIHIVWDIDNTAHPAGFKYVGGQIGLDTGISQETLIGFSNTQHQKAFLYSSKGLKDVYIFHNDFVQYLYFNLNNDNKIVEFSDSSRAPEQLKGFLVKYQRLTSFSPTILYPATLNLIAFAIDFSEFSNFSHPFFADNPVPFADNFPNLSFISIENNKISESDLDYIITDMSNDFHYPPAGLLSIKNQTPTVNTNPNLFSFLTNAGWIVLYN